ncbi:DUF308 domain-containing protein [Leucobacter sp. HY1910]
MSLPENTPPVATTPQPAAATPPTGAATGAATAPAAGPAAAPAKKPRNTIGLVALITAIVGFIFACMPGALIVGWVLLPVAFILSIVSLFMKGKGKGLGLSALILSIVGTIVGFVVFFGTLAAGIDDALSGSETSVSAPQESGDEASTDAASDTDEAAGAEVGTRANPAALGSLIEQGDWSATVNSVNLDASQAIADANQFNEPAPEGSVYVLVNITATYNGTDETGTTPFLTTEFVTSGGNTLKSYDSMVVAPEPFDVIGTLYPGASSTGNFVFTVPAAEVAGGTIAVQPELLGDKVFVAVQ